MTVHDIASYILDKKGCMTSMKLQKLLYYCQAWSLVWDDKPLFSDRVEAWANGPVIPSIYDQHRGQFEVSSWGPGNSNAITGKSKETINSVLEFYGDKTAQWLSDLTHRESPWLEARQGLSAGERGNKEISNLSMAEYYSSL